MPDQLSIPTRINRARYCLPATRCHSFLQIEHSINRNYYLISLEDTTSVITRLLPNWDRNDKFQFLNSMYRLSYFSRQQAIILFLLSGPFAILPTFFEIRTGVDSTTGYIIVSIAMFLSFGLIAKYLDGYFLDELKSRTREKPHIKHSNAGTHVVLLVFSMVILSVIAFGVDISGVMQFSTTTTNLLAAEAKYGGMDGFLDSIAATVLYSSVVFFAVSIVMGGTCVIYYRYFL